MIYARPGDSWDGLFCACIFSVTCSMANRLINEQSPYLLQHAHNPVEWYPWGDEAFERAKKEQKPVIVSIGYAACHWCHVMERESFENEEVATYMNEHFINIKVDREEHPDVDHMYMDAVQAITQSGGWPLNVFVTPQRVPFYGGTYYPPKPLYGRPSWMQVLQQINNIWTNEHSEIDTQSTQMLNYLKQLSAVAFNKDGAWDAAACRKVADTLLAAADTEFGGFGSAPKFPAAMAITYLLEHYHFTGYEPALKQALKSLDAMAEGGIYDQLAGGFARYSTDARWLAPHFEKMLYDNALLVMAYADAYSITKQDKYRRITEQTIGFVNNELAAPEGGFYCALDADSEGVEGKYYTWTWQEWQEATGGDELVEKHYGISKKGNWEGTNILHIAATGADLAAQYGVSEEEVAHRIKTINNTLLEVRKGRVRPATDDKCLLSWNALMNMALSKAGKALQNADYIAQAQRHAKWMLDSYFVNGQWLHTRKNGVSKIAAKLDDYAYTIAAMLQLASVSGDEHLILTATDMIEIVQGEFLHEDKSFFYFTSEKQTDIPARKTDLYDGSVPASNSVMAHNLVLCGMLMESSHWVEQGQYTLRQMAGNAMRYATSFSNWALYGQRMAAGYKTAVAGVQKGGILLQTLQKGYYPQVYIMPVMQDASRIPLLAGKYAEEWEQVHICDTTSCMAPVQDAERLQELLKINL